jgi:succinate dehydrogenase / fumarate reductase, cytochrome b subunit
MTWFTHFLSSSIGRKYLMAFSGLFLMLFLVVHLLGNLQLLHDDEGVAFNTYAYFMTHNPLIFFISITNYILILLHAFMGISLWLQNRAARGNTRYAVNYSRGSETSSRNMAWYGIVIFIFILLHMWQFWFQMKIGAVPEVTVEAYKFPIKNLYVPVAEAFSNIGYVLFYVICMVVIGFHLWHGFWSSFQTLGINHKKYTSLIKALGYIYAIGVPLGFAYIPIAFYLRHH